MKAYVYIGIAIIIFVIAAFSIAWIARHNVLTQPEYKLSIDFVVNNKAIISSFGNVSTISLDNHGTEVDSGTSSSGVTSKEGTYQFRLEGTKRSGGVKISWNSSPNFTPTEIDEILSDGSSVKIWEIGDGHN